VITFAIKYSVDVLFMRSQPKTGAVAAPSSIPPESVPVIELIQEQKEWVFAELQEQRETLFFEGDSVFDVTASDIVDDSLSLSDYDVDDIDGTNDATWKMIYEACLYNKSDNGVLDPVRAVDKYNESNTVDPAVLRFDIDNVTIVETGDTADVFIDPPGIRITASLTDAELYPQHEVAVDVDSLSQFLDEFDQATVTVRPQEVAAFLNTMASDEIQREIGTVDFGLSYKHSKYEPIPASQDTTEDIIQRSVDLLSSFDDLTDDALTTILTTLTSGAFTSEFALKMTDLLLGEADTIMVHWGVLVDPQITNAILRLTDYSLIPIPQESKALITNHNPKLSPSDDFPERQELTQQECNTLSSLLPRYVAFSEWTVAESSEALYNLTQSTSVSQDDLLAYLIQPYDNVTPTSTGVKNAISDGNRLRTLIEETDEQYNTELLSKILRFNEDKVTSPVN